jgi:hypothetical protein
MEAKRQNCALAALRHRRTPDARARTVTPACRRKLQATRRSQEKRCADGIFEILNLLAYHQF